MSMSCEMPGLWFSAQGTPHSVRTRARRRGPPGRALVRPHGSTRGVDWGFATNTNVLRFPRFPSPLGGGNIGMSCVTYVRSSAGGAGAARAPAPAQRRGSSDGSHVTVRRGGAQRTPTRVRRCRPATACTTRCWRRACTAPYSPPQGRSARRRGCAGVGQQRPARRGAGAGPAREGAAGRRPLRARTNSARSSCAAAWASARPTSRAGTLACSGEEGRGPRGVTGSKQETGKL